jgi:hydrogenase nickel incorporation protein HypB
MKIDIVKNILQTNDDNAGRIRARLKEAHVFCINLISAPGAGKTSLLEQILPILMRSFRIAVIEGDLYTTKDSERIAPMDIPVVQINTEGGCHLDASMIEKAMEKLNIGSIDLLIIENVGNLVCPAEFDLGENIKIMVASVTEGNDKPLKYPLMVEKSDAVVLNKMDLAAYTNFNEAEYERDIRAINPDIRLFKTSCVKTEGINELCRWIESWKDAV